MSLSIFSHLRSENACNNSKLCSDCHVLVNELCHWKLMNWAPGKTRAPKTCRAHVPRWFGSKFKGCPLTTWPRTRWGGGWPVDNVPRGKLLSQDVLVLRRRRFQHFVTPEEIWVNCSSYLWQLLKPRFRSSSALYWDCINNEKGLSFVAQKSKYLS